MPATGLLILNAAITVSGNIDPDEVLRYFSWTLFAVIAVVYTVFVFLAELAKDGPFIFSPKNARSPSQVVIAHAMFLTILLCGYRICTYVVPSLPFWWTDTFRGRGGHRTSFFDFLLFFAAFGMAYFERKWLYRGPRPIGTAGGGQL